MLVGDDPWPWVFLPPSMCTFKSACMLDSSRAVVWHGNFTRIMELPMCWLVTSSFLTENSVAWFARSIFTRKRRFKRWTQEPWVHETKRPQVIRKREHLRGTWRSPCQAQLPIPRKANNVSAYHSSSSHCATLYFLWTSESITTTCNNGLTEKMHLCY